MHSLLNHSKSPIKSLDVIFQFLVDDFPFPPSDILKVPVVFLVLPPTARRRSPDADLDVSPPPSPSNESVERRTPSSGSHLQGRCLCSLSSRSRWSRRRRRSGCSSSIVRQQLPLTGGLLSLSELAVADERLPPSSSESVKRRSPSRGFHLRRRSPCKLGGKKVLHRRGCSSSFVRRQLPDN